MTKLLRHEHLLVQARVKKPISDEAIAKQWMIDLVEKVGMVVAAGPIASYVSTPGNTGITAAICLQTSHAAMHVWDEVSPALVQFDIYSCSCIDLDIVWAHMAVMEPDTIEYKFLDRENGFKLISEGTKMFGLNGVGPDNNGSSGTAVS